MHGRDIIQKLKEIEPGVLIVAITADDNINKDKFLKDTGAFDLLAKPFTAIAIRNLLDKAVEELIK